MKNTKELFIRLYTETLYSNFIVPLRGSNYIQLLYCGFEDRLVVFSRQIRWLVWQTNTNGLDQNLTETRLNLYQITTKTLPEMHAFENRCEQFLGYLGTIMSSNVLKCPQKNGALKRCFQAKNVPKVSLKCHQKTKASRLGIKAKKYHRFFIDFSSKKYHQLTTETPPKITAVEGKRRQFQPEEIGVKKCDQMIPSDTKNQALTYHHLILLNSSFMLCC